MKESNFAWGELFKDLYSSSKFRVTLFFGVGTYIYLIKMGSGPLFSLLILIPSCFLASMVFFFIVEQMLLPLYKWLSGQK